MGGRGGWVIALGEPPSPPAKLVRSTISYHVCRRGTYFEFSLVFPDLRASQVRYQSREIGTTVAGQKVPGHCLYFI